MYVYLYEYIALENRVNKLKVLSNIQMTLIYQHQIGLTNKQNNNVIINTNAVAIGKILLRFKPLSFLLQPSLLYALP